MLTEEEYNSLVIGDTIIVEDGNGWIRPCECKVISKSYCWSSGYNSIQVSFNNMYISTNYISLILQPYLGGE